jgi:hypothetical protein
MSSTLGFLCIAAVTANHGRSGKLLLILARTVILGSKSRGTHDFILLSCDFGGRGIPMRQLILNCPLYITFRSDCREDTFPYSSSVVSIVSLCVCICIPPIIARQWLSKHIPPATNTHATVEELLCVSSSM